MQRQYNADSDAVYTSLVSLGVCLRTGAFINPINDAVSKRASPVVNDDIGVSVKNLLEKLKAISIKDKYNPQKVIPNPHHLTTVDDVRSGKQPGIPVDLILAQHMNLNKYASKWVLVRITYCKVCNEFYAYQVPLFMKWGRQVQYNENKQNPVNICPYCDLHSTRAELCQPNELMIYQLTQRAGEDNDGDNVVSYYNTLNFRLMKKSRLFLYISDNNEHMTDQPHEVVEDEIEVEVDVEKSEESKEHCEQQQQSVNCEQIEEITEIISQQVASAVTTPATQPTVQQNIVWNGGRQTEVKQRQQPIYEESDPFYIPSQEEATNELITVIKRMVDEYVNGEHNCQQMNNDSTKGNQQIIARSEQFKTMFAQYIKFIGDDDKYNYLEYYWNCDSCDSKLITQTKIGELIKRIQTFNGYQMIVGMDANNLEFCKTSQYLESVVDKIENLLERIRAFYHKHMANVDMLLDFLEQTWEENAYVPITYAMYNNGMVQCIEMQNANVQSKFIDDFKNNLREALKFVVKRDIACNKPDETHRFMHFNNWRALIHNKEQLFGMFDESSISAVKKIAQEADDLYDDVVRMIARSHLVPYIAIIRSQWYQREQYTNEKLRHAQQLLIKLADFAEKLMDIRPENDFNMVPEFVDESAIDIVILFKDITNGVTMNRAAYTFGDILLWSYIKFDELPYNSEYVYKLTPRQLEFGATCIVAWDDWFEEELTEKGEINNQKLGEFLDAITPLVEHNHYFVHYAQTINEDEKSD